MQRETKRLESAGCKLQVQRFFLPRCLGKLYIKILQATKNIQTTANTFLYFCCCHYVIIKTEASITNQNLSKIIRDVGRYSNCILLFFEVVYNLETFVNVSHCTPDNTITLFR